MKGALRMGGRSDGRGYTTVEVLMAMAVMAIGAAAVMSMQKASVLGNLDARKTDIANSIARTWVERLQRDAMQWTVPGPANPAGASNIANALVLANGAVSVPGAWFRPDQYDSQGLSAGFDILGRDVPLGLVGANPPVFCTGVRITALDPAGLYRADVRVLWPRGISNATENTAPPNPCDVAGVNQPYDQLAYHVIYVTTAIMGNPI